MFHEGNIMSFVPIAHFYYIAMLSFGPFVGFIYTGFMIVSIILYLFFQIKIYFYCAFGFTVLCILINFIKLITGKYGLFYMNAFGSQSYDWKPKVEKEKKLYNPMGNKVLDLNITYKESLSDLFEEKDGVNEKNKLISHHVMDYNQDGIIDEKDIEVASKVLEKEYQSDDEKDDREEFRKLFR